MLRQKISGCLRSHLSTTAKQRVLALDALRRLADGQPCLPAPGSTRTVTHADDCHT